MSAVIIDPGGAQILPLVGDQKATLSTYHAGLTFDADQRTKNPFWRDIAGKLIVRERKQSAGRTPGG